MKKIFIGTIFVAMAVLFSACVEEVNPEATWTLVSLNDGEMKVNKENGSLMQSVSMRLETQEENMYGISGFSGVNHFNGSVTIDGNKMTVESPFAVTMMMGADEAQKVEDSFLRTVQGGGTLSVKETTEGTMLTIKNTKNGTELQFIQTILENTTWNISMYNVGTAVTTVPASVEGVTLGFSEDGKVFGTTGANQLMGTYEYTDTGDLKLSALGITRMAAKNQEVRDFETALVQLLSEVSSFDISGNTLTLRNASGASLLVYVQ